MKRQAQTVDGERVGIILPGDVHRFVLHEEFAAHAQRAVVVAVSDPALEARAIHHFAREAFGVEAVKHLLVHEHVAAARLGFELLDFGDDTAIVLQARCAAAQASPHQRLADEHLARVIRLHPREIDLAPAGEGQPVEGDVLEAAHAPTLFLPERLVVLAADKMLGQRLDPLRANFAHAAGEHPAGLHELGSDDPLGPALGEPGSGKDQQLQVTRAGVLALVGT